MGDTTGNSDDDPVRIYLPCNLNRPVQQVNAIVPANPENPSAESGTSSTNQSCFRSLLSSVFRTNTELPKFKDRTKDSNYELIDYSKRNRKPPVVPPKPVPRLYFCLKIPTEAITALNDLNNGIKKNRDIKKKEKIDEKERAIAFKACIQNHCPKEVVEFQDQICTCETSYCCHCDSYSCSDCYDCKHGICLHYIKKVSCVPLLIETFEEICEIKKRKWYQWGWKKKEKEQPVPWTMNPVDEPIYDEMESVETENTTDYVNMYGHKMVAIPLVKKKVCRLCKKDDESDVIDGLICKDCGLIAHSKCSFVDKKACGVPTESIINHFRAKHAIKMKFQIGLNEDLNPDDINLPNRISFTLQVIEQRVRVHERCNAFKIYESVCNPKSLHHFSLSLDAANYRRILHHTPLNILIGHVKKLIFYMNDSIIPCDRYIDILKIYKKTKPELRNKEIFNILRKLPDENKYMLDDLMRHFIRISQIMYDRGYLEFPKNFLYVITSIVIRAPWNAFPRAMDDKSMHYFLAFSLLKHGIWTNIRPSEENYLYEGFPPFRQDLVRVKDLDVLNLNSKDKYLPEPHPQPPSLEDKPKELLKKHKKIIKKVDNRVTKGSCIKKNFIANKAISIKEIWENALEVHKQERIRKDIFISTATDYLSVANEINLKKFYLDHYERFTRKYVRNASSSGIFTFESEEFHKKSDEFKVRYIFLNFLRIKSRGEFYTEKIEELEIFANKFIIPINELKKNAIEERTLLNSMFSWLLNQGVEVNGDKLRIPKELFSHEYKELQLPSRSYLDRNKWYLPNCTEYEANCLMRGRKDGTFLIRQGKNKKRHILTLKFNGNIHHCIIKKVSKKFRLRKSKVKFDSLEKLIENFMENELTYCNSCLETKLVAPVFSTINAVYTEYFTLENPYEKYDSLEDMEKLVSLNYILKSMRDVKA